MQDIDRIHVPDTAAGGRKATAREESRRNAVGEAGLKDQPLYKNRRNFSMAVKNLRSVMIICSEFCKG